MDLRVRMRLEEEVLNLAAEAGKITDAAAKDNRGVTEEELVKVQEYIAEMKALRNVLARSFA